MPTVSEFGYFLPASRTFVQCRIHGASRDKLASRRSAAFVHRGSTRCALTASAFGPLRRCGFRPGGVVQIAQRLVPAAMQFARFRRTGNTRPWSVRRAPRGTGSPAARSPMPQKMLRPWWCPIFGFSANLCFCGTRYDFEHQRPKLGAGPGLSLSFAHLHAHPAQLLVNPSPTTEGPPIVAATWPPSPQW